MSNLKQEEINKQLRAIEEWRRAQEMRLLGLIDEDEMKAIKTKVRKDLGYDK